MNVRRVLTPVTALLAVCLGAYTVSAGSYGPAQGGGGAQGGSGGGGGGGGSSGTTYPVAPHGGVYTTAAAGAQSVALGDTATAPGSHSTALGYGSTASSLLDVAVGNGANANSSSSGRGNVAVGGSSNATGTGGGNTVVGDQATDNAGAVGFATVLGASATGSANGTVVGNGATSNNGSTVMGQGAVGGGNGTAIGRNTNAGQTDDVVLGLGATSTASNQFVCGSDSSGAPITDVFFGGGALSSSPSNYLVHGTGGSGTDVAGGAVGFAGGEGTGAGHGGQVQVQVSPHATTGAGLNALVTASYWDEQSNVVLAGSGANLAQNATGGFVYLPRCATGAPSGTPTSFTGAAAFVVGGDHHLYGELTSGTFTQIDGGSAPSLSSVLAVGNTTGGHNIVMSNSGTGDQIVFNAPSGAGDMFFAEVGNQQLGIWDAAGNSDNDLRVYAGTPASPDSWASSPFWAANTAHYGTYGPNARPMALVTNGINALGIDTSQLITIVNTVKSYNGVATTGLGVPAVYGLDFRQGRTAADGAATTLYTAVNGTSVFRITADIFATAFTSGPPAIYTIAWTQNGSAQTLVVNATALNTLGTATDLINPDNGTAITGRLTGTFTATVTVTGVVEQIK
jgi:hypothetical protein